MKIPILYKRPYITAVFFVLIGIGAIIYSQMASDTSGTDRYAFLFLGGFAIISGIVIALMYGWMEMRFRRAMGEPLLAFTAEPESHAGAIARTAVLIRATNLMTLVTIWVSCLIIAVAAPFFGRDGWYVSLSMLVLGLVMPLMAWLITRYRTRKLSTGSREVILARYGVYVAGEFHAWDQWGSRLLDLRFTRADPDRPDDPSGLISGQYRLIGAYRSNDGYFNIAVPPHLCGQAATAVEQITQSISGRR